MDGKINTNRAQGIFWKEVIVTLVYELPTDITVDYNNCTRSHFRDCASRKEQEILVTFASLNTEISQDSIQSQFSTEVTSV
jgi:hypothetical protein